MRDSVDASPTGSVNGNAAPVVDANLVLVNGQATPDSGEAAAGRGSSGQGTSGDDGKMCIICIERLMDSGHEIGRPDSGPCRQHLFHLHCLTKWAEVQQFLFFKSHFYFLLTPIINAMRMMP